MDYVLDKLALVGDVSAKKMFGEYGVYSGGKMFGSVCDNQLFIKPTEAGRAFIGEPTEAPPYPGAKNQFLVQEKLDDREWLAELVRLTVAELPMPKPKKPKKK